MATATTTQPGQTAEQLTQVRRLLRQREYRRAIELIDRHLLDAEAVGLSPKEATTDTPVSVGDLRTYAYELLAKRGPSSLRRVPVNLRRGVPVSLRRPVAVDLNRLTRSELERVLRWLLSGEIRAADEALRADEYADAVAAAEAAERIDNRSTHVAMVHARALYELAILALNGQSPDLDAVAKRLQNAGSLAMRAAHDPGVRDAHKKLSVAIDDVSAIVERRRARTARADAVTAVVQRFNRLVQHYDDKDQLISYIQLGNVRASLAQIRADVDRLLQQHHPDSPAGVILVDLRGQCARYKEHLERVGRRLRD
jgi:hypothetical protein